MPEPQDDDAELIQRIVADLFGNLCHYRQHCINERDDAREVIKFVRKSIAAFVGNS